MELTGEREADSRRLHHTLSNSWRKRCRLQLQTLCPLVSSEKGSSGEHKDSCCCWTCGMSHQIQRRILSCLLSSVERLSLVCDGVCLDLISGHFFFFLGNLPYRAFTFDQSPEDIEQPSFVRIHPSSLSLSQTSISRKRVRIACHPCVF